MFEKNTFFLYGGANQYARKIQLASSKKQKSKKRKELAAKKKEFWKKFQAGVLLTLLPVAEAYKQPINLKSKSTKIKPSQIVASCTGNTCRSASLQIHADARGIPFETCGTDPDGASGLPKAALLDSMRRAGNHPNATTYEKTLLDHGRAERQAVSCGCEHLQSEDRPFIIVANPSNKQHLLDKAKQCDVKNIEKRVFVSWDVAPKECSIMKEDPWYKTIPAILDGAQGQLTENQALEEDQAYDKLRDNVEKCLDALTDLEMKDLDKALERESARK